MNQEELEYEIKLFQLTQDLDAAKAAFYADPNEKTLAAKVAAAQTVNAHVYAMRVARSAANPGSSVPTVEAKVKED